MNNIIKVNGNKLRRMMKSALSCSVNSAINVIALEFSEDNIKVSSTDLSQSYKAVVPAEGNISGNIKVEIYCDTLKKIADFPGNEIVISEENGKINLSNEKRKLAISVAKDLIDLDDTYESDEKIMEVEAAELLTAIKTLSPFKWKDDSKPILKGFHFDMSDNTIQCVDGYKGIIKCWKNNTVYNDNLSFTLDSALENIKNVFTKTDGNIMIYNTKRLVIFDSDVDGMKISYAVRKCDGEFFNLKNSFPATTLCTMSVVCGEITEMCKEYKKYINTKEVQPVCLVGNSDGKIHTYLKTHDIIISEATEIQIVSGNVADVYAGYKNEMLIDCFGVFDKKSSVNIRYAGSLSALVVENEEYHVIMQPVRLAINKAEILEYIKETV